MCTWITCPDVTAGHTQHALNKSLFSMDRSMLVVHFISALIKVLSYNFPSVEPSSVYLQLGSVYSG